MGGGGSTSDDGAAERQRQAAAAEAERIRQLQAAAEQQRQAQLAWQRQQELQRQQQAAAAAEAERQRQAAAAAAEAERQRVAAIAAAKTAANEAVAAADAAIKAATDAESSGGAAATAAKTAATNAKTAAVNAQNSANQATSTQAANNAKAAADSAKAAANNAKAAADSAKAGAISAIATAKKVADDALVAADAAIKAAIDAENNGGGTAPKTAAEKAKTDATAAKTAADAAKTIDAANAAKTAADAAKTAAMAAKTAADNAKAAGIATMLTNTKTAATTIADEATTIANSAITVADEAIALGGPSVAAANTAKTSADAAKTAANTAKTAATAATTVDMAKTAKTSAEKAKTDATAAKTAADAAKKGNVDEAEKKCKSPVLMKFTAKAGPNAAVPATGPVSPNVYWISETVAGTTKQFILIPSVDKSSGNNTDALTYCGKIGKFLILYNNSNKERNIQYKIIGVERTNGNSYFKFNIESAGATPGFTKSNIVDGQDIFIRTSESQISSQAPMAASPTVKNPCTDPKTSSNCKRVCIPTDDSGNILYKEGTTIPIRIVKGSNQWLSNYYEYAPVKGVGSDGSLQYYPMDPTQTFVGAGTDCSQPCPPQNAGGVRASYCKPPDENYGKRPAPGEGGRCPVGCIKVDDPTSARNKSACKFDKMKGYTCDAVCDFKGNGSDSCKTNVDCKNCTGDEYITRFPVGWTPTITKNIDNLYTYNECKEKCRNPTQETVLHFLKLDQNGQYLENKCRKIGENKAVCEPISKQTPNGLVAGYDGCSGCSEKSGKYGHFEYEKKWDKDLKQWEFINIKEINDPPRSWFEDGSGAGAGVGGSGYGARDGGMGMGMGSFGARAGEYKRDGNMRGNGSAGGAGDSREMGKLQSGKDSKSFSIGSASQNAKMQEQQSKLEDMKLKINQLNNDYISLSENVKWNKMQMDKAEKDCNDINMKLKKAISDYSKAEAASINVGATIKQKKDTEAANTYMYSVKQKAQEICNNYNVLKDKYMKSVNEMKTRKNNIDDLKKKYDSYSASIGGGGSAGGSMLSPIINIFFGDDTNRDCSGHLGCGQGIDYSFPSPFNSSQEGKFVPKPYEDMIRF